MIIDREKPARAWLFGALLAALSLLAGCHPHPSEGLEGTFADQTGLSRYRFDGHGDVVLTIIGTDHLARYETRSGRVLIHGAQGTIVLRRIDGNTLKGPMGLVLSRCDDV